MTTRRDENNVWVSISSGENVYKETAKRPLSDKQVYEEWERKKKERDKEGWKLHHVCTCGYVASFSENRVLEIYTFPWCPKCEMRNYQAKYRKWVSTSFWTKPSTWFSGYYEWEN